MKSEMVPAQGHQITCGIGPTGTTLAKVSESFASGWRAGTCTPRMQLVQEYVVTNYSIIAHVPSKITAREAAGLPLVGLTTIQAMAPVLRHFQKQGQSSKGKKILIQAGGGGVGSFAIQYCKNVPLGFASRSLVSHIARCHLSSFGLSTKPFSIHLAAFIRNL